MNSLQCQDEILQMMYWMRGEHLGEHATTEQLNRFLRLEAHELDAALEQLVGRGLVMASAAGYSLSERGVVEAGRRFLDEFSAVLGKEDHLSCSDPDCDCQTPGVDAACRSVDIRKETH